MKKKFYIDKPKTQKEQIETMWEFLFNDCWHRLKWQDIKINFILAFMGIVLTLLALIMVATLWS